MKLLAIFLLLVATNAFGLATGPGKLVFTVLYCPTYFSSAGAIIEVDPTSGKYSVYKKFKWPSEITGGGCAALDDPSFVLDRSSGTLYLDFTEDFGALIAVNIASGTTKVIKPHSTFFTGFENMALVTPGQVIAGTTPTVEQSGYCDNGCFAVGQFDVAQSKYKKLADIPFKACLDDSHYYDPTKHIYYVQASYDLREEGKTCAPNPEDECLLAIDASNGNLISATYTANWTVYDYSVTSTDPTKVLAFVEGFDSMCKDPYNNFLFAYVNLQTAVATPIQCISKNASIDEGPWMSDFALDNSLFATASGDAEAGAAQLLVFNPNTGATITNSQLTGLGKALGAVNDLFWIWGVSFVPSL